MRRCARGSGNDRMFCTHLTKSARSAHRGVRTVATMHLTRIILASGAVAVAVAVSGCGSSTPNTSIASSSVSPSGSALPTAAPIGSSPGATNAARSAAAPTTALGGVNPNAPEVNEVGDIPDNQVFVPYATSSGLYTVKFPEGWSRTGDGDNVSFTDKLNAIQIAVVDKPTAPTSDSVTTVDLTSVSAKSTNFTAGKVSSVNRKGGEAILATYEIDSAPNAVTGKSIRVAVERYEFWKNGKSVVVTLIGAVGADNVDPWLIVTDSFAWLK
jgi:hypothetical protein